MHENQNYCNIWDIGISVISKSETVAYLPDIENLRALEQNIK